MQPPKYWHPDLERFEPWLPISLCRPASGRTSWLCRARASDESDTQNRLATGKKVNSALDNPGNFFTSQSLSNRASDLNSLLDSIGQAQQTLKAADTGLTSLTKLVESAKSIAKQAQQASAARLDAATTRSPSPATRPTRPSAPTTAARSTVAERHRLHVRHHDQRRRRCAPSTYTSDATATCGEIIAGLNADLDTEVGAAAGTDHRTRCRRAAPTASPSTRSTADIDFRSVDNTTAAGLTDGTYNSTSLLDNIVTAGGADGDTLSLTVNGGANQSHHLRHRRRRSLHARRVEHQDRHATGVTGPATKRGHADRRRPRPTARRTASCWRSSTAGLATALGISQNGTTPGHRHRWCTERHPHQLGVGLQQRARRRSTRWRRTLPTTASTCSAATTSRSCSTRTARAR